MKNMKVEIKKIAFKKLKRIPRNYQLKILEQIYKLEDNPYPVNSKKLQNFVSTFRLRVGDYRVIYEVKESKLYILVIKIGYRKGVYR